MAFNAKNLHYDAKTPAFLQRLKAGYAAADGRSNVKQIRPGKSRLRNGDDDDDDGPVMVDEHGEVVGKEEWEGMVSGKSKEEGGDQAGVEGVNTLTEKKVMQGDEEKERQKVVGVGDVRQKKRKVGKVVIDEDDGDGDRVQSGGKESEREVDDSDKRPAAALKIEGKRVSDSGGVTKPKKKAKKIKLSFDEPE